MRIIYKDYLTDSTTAISANSEVESAGRVANLWPSKQWISSAQASSHVDFDLGATATVNAFGLVNYNFKTGISAGGGTGPSASLWKSTNGTSYNKVASAGYDVIYFSATLARYWRLLIHAGTTDGDHRIGRAVMGKYWQPSSCVANEPDLAMIDPTGMQMTEGGSIHLDKRNGWDEVKVDCRWFDTSELDEFRTITQSAQGQPQYITLLEGELSLKNGDDLSYYGTITGQPGRLRGTSWVGAAISIKEWI